MTWSVTSVHDITRLIAFAAANLYSKYLPCRTAQQLVLDPTTKALTNSRLYKLRQFWPNQPALTPLLQRRKSPPFTSCHRMPPKRQKETKSATASKKSKTGTSDSGNSTISLVESLISDKLLGQTYCEELGIDLSSGTNAVFQWLACSSMFGSRLSETITMRAARGLLESQLTTPQAISEAPLEEEVEALHSEGNVQRAPSMSHFLNQTSKAVLDKYKGDLDNLRKQAKHHPAKERELVKEFKGFGDVAVNIFCREAQEVWEEQFPFADDRSLKLAAEHGLPDNAAKLAELVDNDRHKFVRLLAALIRSNLRKVPVDDEKATVDSGVLKKQKEEHEQYKKDNINTEKVEQQKREANDRYPQ